jgi:LysM repeat protein
MRQIIYILTFSTSFLSLANEPVKKLTQSDYVGQWKNVAIEQMRIHRIPASITLAQGILESANGNSPLATEANNHFGIKCHDWQGEKVYFDDDQAQECFRKYPNAGDSYKDHSLFLTSKQRYSELFKLPVDDYKSWANGLRTAGYATSPKYAISLIELIERLKLDQYDDHNLVNGNELLAKEIKNGTANQKTSLVIDESAAIYESHTVKTHKNNVNYIVARKGDTYYKISKEFQISMWQLYKYNDFGPKKELLEIGDIVYLEPKRARATEKGAVYIAKTDISLIAISQQEGIKLSSLMKMNELSSENAIVSKGQKILLR